MSSTTGSAGRTTSWLARVNWLGIGFIVALFLVWELLDRLGLITFDYLPAPSFILTSFGVLVASGEFLPAVGHTVTVALSGWAIASTAGIILGTWLGMSKIAWRWSMATADVFRSLPSIVLLPIALLLFGFSVEAEYFLVIFGALWPVLVSTVEGIRQLPRSQSDVAATLQLPFLRKVKSIILPAALPTIFVGLRLGLTLALVLAIAAEMLGNPEGMGFAMIRAQEMLSPGDMFVYILTVGLIGVIANGLFALATKLIFPGHAARAGRSRR